MKMKFGFTIILTFFLLSPVMVATGHDDALGEKKAVAFFPESTYEFEPVVEGTQVIHEFVLQNKGTLPLMVEKVLTG